MGTVKILMYGTVWCGDTIRAKRLFEKYKVDFDWINIDKDPEGVQRVKEINNGYKSVPTIIFPDGSIFVEPDDEILKNKFIELGLV